MDTLSSRVVEDCGEDRAAATRGRSRVFKAFRLKNERLGFLGEFGSDDEAVGPRGEDGPRIKWLELKYYY